MALVRPKMTTERSWGERVYTQVYSHGGRSVTRIPSAQSESACSKPVSAFGPLDPQPSQSLSLVLPPLQPLLSCSPAAVQQPRALGRTLYIESVTMHCPHVCSEQANQGQVRILATGNFTLSTIAFQAEGTAEPWKGEDTFERCSIGLTG